MYLAKLGNQAVEPGQVSFRPVDPAAILLSEKRWRRRKHDFPGCGRVKSAIVLRQEAVEKRCPCPGQTRNEQRGHKPLFPDSRPLAKIALNFEAICQELKGVFDQGQFADIVEARLVFAGLQEPPERFAEGFISEFG